MIKQFSTKSNEFRQLFATVTSPVNFLIMALSKQPYYSIKDQTTANIARALSHSARVKILKQLAEKGECCVQEIAKGHPISPAALSNHLKILREAQLVIWREQFPYTFYSLHTNTIAKNRLDLNNYFDLVDIN